MPELPVFSVSELTRQLKGVVELSFPCVAVVGEISNFSRSGSGHCYLTLKDEGAQLRAVVWRTTAQRLRFDMHDGLEVLAAGRIEVYPARGTYQLVVDQLVPQGIGALELAFRQLQEKLAGEGLFAPERKRPLPRFPRRIALVTSPTGAAVRDMLQVITRRWQAADIVIVPVPVQGAGAAEQIATALRGVHRIPGVDVVVTGRGGGSLEDLWAFNEEAVARAIFECPVPVVSAVGHEIDVSIADLVADRRALTPSEAAELVVPHRAEVLAELNACRQCLGTAMTRRLRFARMQVDACASRRVLTKPLARIHELAERLDVFESRLRRAIRSRLEGKRQHLARLSASLHALSPLGVLERGYSITRNAETGDVVRSSAQLAAGDWLRTTTSEGEILSVVSSPKAARQRKLKWPD